MSMGQVAVAVEQKPEGFIDGSTFSLLNRNLYFNRDYRKGQSSPTGNGYVEEWAHGIIGRFDSGLYGYRRVWGLLRRARETQLLTANAYTSLWTVRLGCRSPAAQNSGCLRLTRALGS